MYYMQQHVTQNLLTSDTLKLKFETATTTVNSMSYKTLYTELNIA